MIKIKNIEKNFKNGSEVFLALDNVSLEIPENKITIISGPSGSGKSTLLSILGLLQTPTSGKLIFDDNIIDFKDNASVREFIRDNIAYVFQEFNLIEDFSVIDNLSIVCNDSGIINQILDTIRLSNKKTTPTKMLSGGEKQRLSIGRAIAKGGGNLFYLMNQQVILMQKMGELFLNYLKSFLKKKQLLLYLTI